MTEQEPKEPLPLTPDELADRVVPAEPRISLDGRSVAFVAAPAGQKGEHPERALWLWREGGPARKLTAGAFDDRSPRWSPDGSRLLFLSDRVKRGDESGVYLLPMAGGEAERLGDLVGALQSPAWSPDGATVALLRTDPKPDARKQREEERDDAVEVDVDPRFTRLWAIDAATGKARCLTTGEREVRSFCWKPDGSGLVAVTTALPGWNEAYFGADLWEVPTAGGRPRRLASFPVLPGAPVVVGETVVVPGEGGRPDPAVGVSVVDLAGSEPRNLLPDWEGEVSEVAVLPGRPADVAFQAVRGVHGGLFALPLAGGQPEPVPIGPDPVRERGSISRGATFSADGARVAFVWSDGSTPEEVWVGDVGGGAESVTNFGESFEGRLQPVEVVRWVADDGVEIEGLLTYPVAYQPGQRSPLVVEIHGGPSWQWEERVMLDWHDWAQMLASRGIAVLLPNPRGSTGRGAAFARLLQDDVGGGESRDLIAGAEAMVERGIADPDRLGIGGWSWGGYLTAMTTTKTTMFKAAVMGAGVANNVSDHAQGDIPAANLLYFAGEPYHHPDAYWAASPVRSAAKVTTPTLILHGDADARVHPGQSMEWYRALKTLGVPVEFVRYPREEHPIRERAHQIDLMRRVDAWFRRWLLA
ncbi:MAG TPA: S9 family peptidase [Thermomicrobiales bacterium]|nr:S9 family peptidase [Thermomicrobiales bacterium]